MIIPHFFADSDNKVAVHHLTPDSGEECPVVVMCHPTGFCGLCYSSVASHLRNLNIFAIDMRSHGLSNRGDLQSWNSFKSDIENAFKAIKSKTNFNKVYGVGISSGSSAHILNASDNPGLYAGLYLCEPILFPPGADLTHREALAKSARNRRSEFTSRYEAFQRFSGRGPLSKLNPSTLGLYCMHGFKDTENGVSLSCRPEDEEAIYLSGGANGVFEALSNIDCPTKIVFGETSDTYDLQRATFVSANVSFGEVESLEGCGHFTLFEKPYLGAMRIQAFIDSIDN